MYVRTQKAVGVAVLATSLFSFHVKAEQPAIVKLMGQHQENRSEATAGVDLPVWRQLTIKLTGVYAQGNVGNIGYSQLDARIGTGARLALGSGNLSLAVGGGILRDEACNGPECMNVLSLNAYMHGEANVRGFNVGASTDLYGNTALRLAVNPSEVTGHGALPSLVLSSISDTVPVPTRDGNATHGDRRQTKVEMLWKLDRFMFGPEYDWTVKVGWKESKRVGLLAGVRLGQLRIDGTTLFDSRLNPGFGLGIEFLPEESVNRSVAFEGAFAPGHVDAPSCGLPEGTGDSNAQERRKLRSKLRDLNAEGQTEILKCLAGYREETVGAHKWATITRKGNDNVYTYILTINDRHEKKQIEIPLTQLEGLAKGIYRPVVVPGKIQAGKKGKGFNSELTNAGFALAIHKLFIREHDEKTRLDAYPESVNWAAQKCFEILLKENKVVPVKVEGKTIYLHWDYFGLGQEREIKDALKKAGIVDIERGFNQSTLEALKRSQTSE